jgi:Protein of unknown function (DUF429)
MPRVKNILLGLDPGGIGKFGWCVADAGVNCPIEILETGKADHAQAAITAVQKYLSHIPILLKVVAVGIDAPLFWTADGDREADICVRNAIKAKGAKNVYGTVQNINALRGACLVQGILSARLLRDLYPKIRITESHPKALLWLLKAADQSSPLETVTPINISKYVEFDTHRGFNSEHERDAALGALAAWHMLNPGTWHNLFDIERFPFAPVPKVEYWMPIR